MLKQMMAALASLVFAVGAAQAQTQSGGQSPASSVAQSSDEARFADPITSRGAQISPSGNYVAYIKRTATQQQVTVLNLATNTEQVVQQIAITTGYIFWMVWKGDDRIVLGAMFNGSSHGSTTLGTRLRRGAYEYKAYRVVAFGRDGSNFIELFHGQDDDFFEGGGSNFLADALPNDPQHVLISVWDFSGGGVYRADVTTGHTERVARGALTTVGYATDGNGEPVIRIDEIIDSSGFRIYRRAPGEQEWTPVMIARHAAAVQNSPDFTTLGAGPGAGQVYVLGRAPDTNLSTIYLFNSVTGERGAPLQQNTIADAATPWIQPWTHQILALCEFAARMRCQSSDPGIQRNLNAIDSFFEHDATVMLAGMSQDGQKWLLSVDGPTMPGGYYLYDLAAHRMTPIADMYPHVDESALSPTRVETYQSSDGHNMWAYVTAKPQTAPGPRPMVVLPHGGPEARDFYAFNGFVQLLAARGYVVVQPNFRGGAGFGAAFADAGRHEWGRRMQADITDAVHHMISAGIADPHRICIVGASYGGYAALAGAALTPDLYRCAVSIAGVSDLIDMLRNERTDEHQSPLAYQYWRYTIGDPAAEHDALVAASPAEQAAHVVAPLLLIHGEKDDNVPIHQSEMMDQAMRAAGHPAHFVRIPDEGHYWDLWTIEHRLQMFREVDAFLAQNLGAPGQ